MIERTFLEGSCAYKARKRNLLERTPILAQEEGSEIPTTHANGQYQSTGGRAAHRVTREVVMFASRQNRGAVNAEVDRFLFELEEEFDLMRLRARRTILEQEETRLAEKQESLRNGLGPPVAKSIGPSEAPAENGRMRGWWRAVATRFAIWRVEIRRVGLAEEMRGLALLEEEIEFALRLRRGPSRG